jgi:hypothetical protein
MFLFSRGFLLRPRHLPYYRQLFGGRYRMAMDIPTPSNLRELNLVRFCPVY